MTTTSQKRQTSLCVKLYLAKVPHKFVVNISDKVVRVLAIIN